MILAIVLIIFMGAIAFFHYLQGFFSATLSAIFAVVAAVIAFSYHETVVEHLLQGKVANMAHAMVLLMMFAAIYLILRIIFDKIIPGNVRMPVAVDKAGAAIMGIIAGVFATGIVAIAAQEMPFWPSLFGYVRADVNDDKTVSVPTVGRSIDSKVWEELSVKEPGKLGPDKSLLVPVDDIVVGTVAKLSSATGALEDGKPLASIHPDFLGELFGQRLGIEPGATRVTMNVPDRPPAVQVKGLYRLEANVPQQDAEYVQVRGNGNSLSPIKLGNNEMFLVVRLMFTTAAAEQDNIVRFSPGSVHLVAPAREAVGGESQFVDVYPIGTLDNGGTDKEKLWLNKADDYVFVNTSKGHGADLVFRVDKRFEKQVPPGTLIEFKRLIREDLSNDKVAPKVAESSDVVVMRKPKIVSGEANPPPTAPPGGANPRGAAATPAQPPPQPQPQSTAPPSSAAQSSFQFVSATASSELPVLVTVANGAADQQIVPVPKDGTAVLKGGKAVSLNTESAMADQNLPQKVTEFAVPEGQAMVQVRGKPGTGGSSPWACYAEADQIEVADSTGKHYPPNGVFARYTAKGADHIAYLFTAAHPLSGGEAKPQDAEAAPSEIVYFYIVPPGSTIPDIFDHGQKIASPNVSAAAK